MRSGQYIPIGSKFFRYCLKMEKYPFLNETIGKILRQKRESMGMSKRQLSTLASIERAYITGIEQGKWNVSLNALFHLCEALEIDPQELMGMVKKELEAKNGKSWPFLS